MIRFEIMGLTLDKIEKKVYFGEDGKPMEVLLSWDTFVDLAEVRGLDLSEEEQRQLDEALEDSKNRNMEAFTAIDEV